MKKNKIRRICKLSCGHVVEFLRYSSNVWLCSNDASFLDELVVDISRGAVADGRWLTSSSEWRRHDDSFFLIGVVPSSAVFLLTYFLPSPTFSQVCSWCTTSSSILPFRCICANPKKRKIRSFGSRNWSFPTYGPLVTQIVIDHPAPAWTLWEIYDGTWGQEWSST